MIQDSTEDEKIKEAERIYAETMAKLNELQKVHREILASAKKRVEEEKLNKIRQNLH